jgi:hypothetical protein
MARGPRCGCRQVSRALALFFTALAVLPAASEAAVSAWVGLYGPAGRVVRGRCVAAAPVVVAVGGARIAATEYTFAVSETLKGPAGTTLRFRQVGRPEGGRGDLGELVGLPVYSPGTEYVLFLLPESRSLLTSPVSAAGGAFFVRGDSLVASGISHAIVAPPGGGPSAPTLSGLRAALRAAGRP